jgi:hypothetical protein
MPRRLGGRGAEKGGNLAVFCVFADDTIFVGYKSCQLYCLSTCYLQKLTLQF